MLYGRHPKNRTHSGIHTALDLLHAHNVEEIVKDLAKTGALLTASTIESDTAASYFFRSALELPRTPWLSHPHPPPVESSDLDIETPAACRNMSGPPDLKSWLRSRIHNIRKLLMEKTQVRNPAQEITHRGHTRGFNALTLDTTGPPDTKAIYGKNINTTDLEDFETHIHNIELKTNTAYNDLRIWEAHNTRPATTLVHPETSLEDRLHNIETHLIEAEKFQGVALNREYTQRTNKLIEEAKITLLDTEARHGIDINTRWDSLDHATCNINNIDIATDNKLDVCKYKLLNLKKIHERIQITKQRLAEMTSPTQEHVYEKYIKRIEELTLQANKDLEASHRKDIPPTKLKHFKISLHNIEQETLAVYSNLYTRKAYNASPPIGTSKTLANFAGFMTTTGGSVQDCTATVETKPNNLARSLESNQVKNRTRTQDPTSPRAHPP